MGWEDQERDELGRFGEGSSGADDSADVEEFGISGGRYESGAEAVRAIRADATTHLELPFAHATKAQERAMFKQVQERGAGEWNAELEEVDVADLVAAQEGVTARGVEKYLKQHDNGLPVDNKPILGVRVRGKVLIWNGHHRATAARMLGYKKIAVEVWAP